MKVNLNNPNPDPLTLIKPDNLLITQSKPATNPLPPNAIFIHNSS